MVFYLPKLIAELFDHRGLFPILLVFIESLGMVVVGKEANFWGWNRSEVVNLVKELGQRFLEFCGDIVFVPGLMVAVDDVFQFEILTAGAFESLPLSVLFSPTL